MKNPPILIAVLGFFAALAGFGYLFYGLRVLGFDWFGLLGNLPRFESVGLWGWLAIATGIIWILAAVGLWSLQAWARAFALIISGFAIFEAVLAFLQFPGTGVGFAMGLMPAVIFWYLSTDQVKAAFSEEPLPAVPDAPARIIMPAAAAAATPAPAASPAPAAVTAASDEPAPARDRMQIEDVEGIGPAEAEKLAAVGITTTDDLLAAGARRYDRERLAETTGISSQFIRDWVDKVDLMRVPGVGPQYSDLLEAAGVDSPAELAQRNPTNLAVTIQEVVAARPGIVRRTPNEEEIAAWIEAAGTLDKVVEH